MNDTPATPPAGENEPTPQPRPDDTRPLSGHPGPTGPPPSFGPPSDVPYGAPAAGHAAAPTALAVKERPRRARGALVASVLATSLLVGGAAGVGGAAAYSAWHDDDSTNASASTASSSSNVVDSGDSPAASGSVEAVATTVLPSVVKINVTGSQESGSGSGIILTSDGTILTNNHVVEVAGDGGSITVDFNDGTSAKATVLGTDPLTDTAVIKATDVSGLTPATIGKSSNLDVGESVVAIGSPFGLNATVTSGIVSALNRPVDVGSDAQGNSTTYPAIQTDAAINPGNSGGPLVDMEGHVIGINSSIRTASSSSEEQAGSIGLGFSIPIDEVMPIVDQMVKGETPTHARLGISVADVGAAQSGSGAAGGSSGPSGSDSGALVTEGAQIQEVTDGSTAASAGLAKGDVITKIDDQQITGADSLVATIRSYRPGDSVTVTYEKDGSSKTAKLTLDSDATSSTS